MTVGESVVGEGLADVPLNQIRRLAEPLTVRFGNHRVGLLLGSRAVLLGMDRLEHVGYLTDFA